MLQRTKESFQQKWITLVGLYKDARDSNTTGTEPNDWEFYDEMDDILKCDPTVEPPVIRDSMSGVKRKMDDDDERKSKKNGSTMIIEEFKELVTSSTNALIQFMKEEAKRQEEVERERQRKEEQRNDKMLDIFQQIVNKM
jgi:hypothetical protein